MTKNQPTADNPLVAVQKGDGESNAINCFIRFFGSGKYISGI